MLSKTALIVPSLLLAAGLTPAAATAAPPVGVCPDHYSTLTRGDVALLPDADLALAAFDVVNANGDDLVCYRPYRNAPHQGGHYGNFVDNTAAPHS